LGNSTERGIVPNKLATVLAVPVATAVIVMGALCGCAPATTGNALGTHARTGSGTNAPSPVVTPTATPTPTPAGPPPLPANALFRISATVTAPGGAAADLVQTVFMPAPLTAAQKAQLTAHCGAQGFGDSTGEPPWKNNFATATGLTSTITATLHAGSPAWNNSANAVLADFVGSGDFTGAYGTFEAYCSPGYILIPGTQQALAPIQAANPGGQPYGWAGEFAGYGFYGGGNDPGAPDLGGGAVVSNCLVQLSGTAAANATAAAWATHIPKLIDGCEYGGAQVP
jgi:hypothetical protein